MGHRNMGRRGLGPGVHLEIRRRVARGELRRVIAAEMGVSQETIRQTVRKAGAVPPRRKNRALNQLSADQREQIALGIAAGEKNCAIAVRIGVAASTLSRELNRNGGRDGYRAWAAEARAFEAALRPGRPRKLVDNPELAAEVNRGLAQRWSPEEISGRLKIDFPDRPEMHVSHETIYQTMFLQAKGKLKTELTLNLRRGRVQRRPMSRASESTVGKIPGMAMISERPAEADDRAVPGHWEGDLIIGANNASSVATIVERTSRYLLLIKLERSTTDVVCNAVAAKIIELPDHLKRSLTWDQGKEMAAHVSFTVATGVQVYFCDPHSPWQRGTNENTNGLAREYLPKGSDLSIYSQDDLDAIAHELNGRPRQTLGWMKPSEKFAELVALVA